jgi:hypothetical protein
MEEQKYVNRGLIFGHTTPESIFAPKSEKKVKAKTLVLPLLFGGGIAMNRSPSSKKPKNHDQL